MYRTHARSKERANMRNKGYIREKQYATKQGLFAHARKKIGKGRHL